MGSIRYFVGFKTEVTRHLQESLHHVSRTHAVMVIGACILYNVHSRPTDYGVGVTGNYWEGT